MRWRWLVFLLALLTSGGWAGGSLESAVVAEVNLLRTQPRAYAQFLKNERAAFQGMLRRNPRGVMIQTQEGVAALDEAVSFLEQQPPVKPLLSSPGLALACLDHAQDQGRSGDMGHRGGDNSFVQDRAARYGTVNGVGENIMYGSDIARDIVMQLVIDDGVADRGHRTNFFRPEYSQIGVACGSHPRLRQMCVVALAVSYQDNPQAQAGRRLPATADTPATVGSRPSGNSNLSPYQQARAIAEAHFRACLEQDREAWVATLTRGQRASASALWRQARSTSTGATYVYGCTEQTTPELNRFRFLRRSGGQITPCFITLIRESGRWLVDEVSY